MTQPKFVEIADLIIEKIKSGELLPGDKIPSETELITQYGVSNTTARKSLYRIELEGYVKRIKGKGTYVLNRTEEHNLMRVLGSIDATRKGYDETLRAEGFTPKLIMLEKTVLKDGISSQIMGRHLIIPGPVLKIHQLRYADDFVMKDEVRYVSLALCPRIDRLPTEVSFFSVYENEYKLKLTDVKQTLSTTIVQPDEPNNFEFTRPEAIFILDSAIFSGDKVVEIERSYYRGDKYTFAIIAHPQYNGGLSGATGKTSVRGRGL